MAPHSPTLSVRLGLIAAILLAGCQFSNPEYRPSGPGIAPPPVGPEIVDVAAGLQHTCALRADGTVRCWGANQWGQLGSGPSTGLSEPRDVAGLNNVVDLSSGGDTTCALLDDGTVRCWGPNDLGQLGQQNTAPYFAPVGVAGLTDVVQVDVGGTTSCGLRSDGTVWCWGGQRREENGRFYYDLPEVAPVGDASDMIQISVGGSQGCGVRSDSTLWCWNEHDFPRRVAYLLPASEGALKVIHGGWYTYVLYGDQTYGWFDIYPPLEPPFVIASDLRVVQEPDLLDLCVGGYHTCLLYAAGNVRCFGHSSDSPVGNSAELAAIVDAAAVACGINHSCVIHDSGAVSCWGRNDVGALGDGSSTDRTEPVWVTSR